MGYHYTLFTGVLSSSEPVLLHCNCNLGGNLVLQGGSEVTGQHHVTMDKMADQKSIAIVGGGLVGALQAMFMAKTGFEVHLYESRADIRGTGELAAAFTVPTIICTSVLPMVGNYEIEWCVRV